MLILNVLQGPDKGKRFELPDHGPQLIGRSSESLMLGDNTISRRHAELTPDDGAWYIRDLESANGTYVNGVSINQRTLLNAGDQIRTGATLLVFGVGHRETAVAPIRVADADRIDVSVESTVASNDDSVIMAVPEPTAEANRQLLVLYQLMQLVGSIFDRQVLLERVMDLVFEHFEADRGFVLLQESVEATADPTVVRYRRKPREKDSRSITASRTIVQHVLQRREGVLSANAMSDRRFSSGDSVQAYLIRSAICVPMIFHDRVFGVIHIDSQIANYTFTEDQLRLMTAIGAQTGMALLHAELYQQGLQNARLAAVGETVASLSHSIKNILQGMRGGAELVELGMRKEDLNVMSNGWGILGRNLDRIYELTLNMLAYSKQRHPDIEMMQLPALFEEILALIQPLCDNREVALITEIEDDMPPIPADAGGLHQAIVNLLHNALDAVKDASGVITLRCSYDDVRHEVRIDVSDNGVGIEPDSQAELFTPFYSTKGQRGTGLGLPVARKIIDEHQGRIAVESEPGTGSTFTITLSTEASHDPSATN